MTKEQTLQKLRALPMKAKQAVLIAARNQKIQEQAEQTSTLSENKRRY